MTSQIMYAQLYNIHTPLRSFTWHLRHFYKLPLLRQVMAFHPTPGDIHQSTGGRSERTQGQAKMTV